MTKGQFRCLFGALLVIIFMLGGLLNQSQEIFGQTRWMTWKLDQSGSSRIKVDIEP